MYLERTSEQRLLHENALRFLADRGRDARWTELAEMGWIAAAFTEEDGGLGGRAADVVPICEAIGASGTTLSYFSSVLLPAGVLALAPPFKGRGELIESFIAGKKKIAVAHVERTLVFAPEEPATFMQTGASGTITGSKRRVWDAKDADVLLVSARDGERFGWYLVEARGPGVAIEPAHADDEMPWANVQLANSKAVEICAGDAAHVALAQAISFAITGVLAESVGGMGELLRLTQEWLATRMQFGRPLAANQVLSHRLVDMFVALEEARSMLNLAVYAHDCMPPEDARASIHAAKAHVANCARFVGQQAVHLHGAMGLTEESFVGRAYRRLEALNAVFGSAEYHTWAYALRSAAIRKGN